MNTRNLIFVAAATALLALSACEQAKAPAQVAADTAKAEQSAQQNSADAATKATDKMAKSDTDMRTDQSNQAHEAAVQNQNMAVTDAEGAHKVALAQCEALSGDAQRNCKKQADADLDAAKAAAKQTRTAQDPAP